MPKTVVIDGLIGAGKSTCIGVLHKTMPKVTDYTVLVCKEPVDLWKSSGRLAMFYSDMKRRSFQFQCLVFHSRVRQYQQVYQQAVELEADGKNVLILMERSIFSDCFFANILHEQGDMDDSELEDYMDLWQMWTETMPAVPDIFIFLRPKLNTVMERLHDRNRSEESGVSRDYQQHLLVKHDDWYEPGERDLNGQHCPMHVLDTDFNYRDSEEGARRLTEMILEVI